jgi:uncharacterized protein involved in exopolysaccharide biosynthesis
MNSDKEQSLTRAELVADDEIDLVELWRALLARKWLIIGITFLFAAASVLYALSLPDMYKSEALLAPAEQSDSNSLGRMAGQLGGLASFAGINLGRGGASSKSTEALEILQSWSFIEEFIQEQGIVAEVFAVKSWDKKTGQLLFNEGMYNAAKKEWLTNPETGETLKPGSWVLYDAFVKGYLTVSTEKETGFTTISVEYYSPKLAEQWVNALIKKLNKMIQERDIRESEKNIAFLKQQIESTSITSMQSVFYQLLESQTKTLMLAKGSEEYVFRSISKARAPEIKSRPKRAIMCVVGTMSGLMLGILMALVLAFIRKEK